LREIDVCVCVCVCVCVREREREREREKAPASAALLAHGGLELHRHVAVVVLRRVPGWSVALYRCSPRMLSRFTGAHPGPRA